VGGATNQNKLANQPDATIQKGFENHPEPRFAPLARDTVHQNTFLREYLNAINVETKITIKSSLKKIFL